MKKNKGLIFLASLLTIFFVGIANAEAKTVNVYFFNMNGCSHCAEAKEFFAELEADEEYLVFKLQPSSIPSLEIGDKAEISAVTKQE